jgi:hypothetical protein
VSPDHPDFVAYFVGVTIFGSFLLLVVVILILAVSPSRSQTIKRMLTMSVATTIGLIAVALFLPRWTAYFVGMAWWFLILLSSALSGWLHVHSLKKDPFRHNSLTHNP